MQLVRSATKRVKSPPACWGADWVTIQTGSEGKQVNQVLIEVGCNIARELYLGIVLDRAASKPVIMCSQEGGVEIEKWPTKPQKKSSKNILIRRRFGKLPSSQVVSELGITGKSVQVADQFMRSLCRMFVEMDCSLVEVNPLVVTGEGALIALDAKVTFDDNAAFRHREWLTCET